MFELTETEKDALERLSERIQRWRVNHESIGAFAARIGTSAPTYSKLEKADPTVALGVLVRALSLSGNLKNLDRLFVKGAVDELFESPMMPPRQRARRKNRSD